MTTRTLQILLALLEGPLHGYGIKQQVEARTDGRVRLGSGTLYEAVHRLVEQGSIEEVPAPPDEPSSGGPPRRFYALTPEGRRTLAEEIRRLDSLVTYARDRDLLADG
ncbi:MAG: helix-turn-helix transcriptional regulator [Longimicrobiales bacterium]